MTNESPLTLFPLELSVAPKSEPKAEKSGRSVWSQPTPAASRALHGEARPKLPAIESKRHNALGESGSPNALVTVEKFADQLPLVCDLDAPDVAPYQMARATEDAAGAAVNKEFTVPASILADRGLWNGILRDAKRVEENESAGRALLADEDAQLLRVAAQAGVKQGHWSPIYTVSVLGLNTGLRHSEVRQLRSANVDLG